MKRTTILSVFGVVFLTIGCAKSDAPGAEEAAAAKKVYGEWRIRLRPESEADYNKLIEEQGLALYTEAGGRLMGWWHAYAGGPQEQVTIWEFDDIGAYRTAMSALMKNDRYRQFDALWRPLVDVVHNRLLRLPIEAEPATVPERAPFLIYEQHHVPYPRLNLYLDFMFEDGLEILRRNGFRPTGPFLINVGRWSDVTYVFRYTSPTEREELRAKFAETADAKDFTRNLRRYIADISTRMMVPAPFTIP